MAVEGFDGTGSAAAEPSAKKFVLRLDDGSFIGPSSRFNPGEPSTSSATACFVSVERAFELGKVSFAQLTRLENLVQQYRSRLAQHGVKREAGGGVEGGNPAKRARADVTASAGTANTHDSGGTAWGQKCQEVLKAVMTALGKDVVIFDHPVSALEAPDYHTIVLQPMDLGTIGSNLQVGRYSSPHEFFEDMMQVWKNCKLYNKAFTPIARAGERASKHFEKLWSEAGLLDGNRQRRQSGRSAKPNEKYLGMGSPEEEDAAARKAAKSSKKSKKAGKNGTGGSSGKKRMGGKLGGKGPSSYPKMTPEQLADLADRLGSLEEDVQLEAVNLLNSTGVNEGNGEVEIDFDKIDTPTLWKLYDFIQRKAGNGAGRPGGAGSGTESDGATDSSSDEEDNVDWETGLGS